MFLAGPGQVTQKSDPGSDLEPAQKTHLAKRFSDIELFAMTVLPEERH